LFLRFRFTQGPEVTSNDGPSHGRAYGFDVSSSYAWIKGPNTAPAASCHWGYAGTSLVCDPSAGTHLIILTNSIHPRDKGTSRPIRQKLAEIVFPAPTGPGPQ
jgi:CubicO group peptidase (beta-lactamase class C family)